MASAHTDRLPTISRRQTLVTTTVTGPAAAAAADNNPSDATATATAATDAASETGGGGGRGGGGGGSTMSAGTLVSGGGGVGGGGDRRTLLGVGTYLIDTPKDPALTLRQRFLSFHEMHRGLLKAQNETLPDIPFRLNPRPDSPPSSTVTDSTSKHIHAIMVDMATSPLFPYDDEEDLNLGLSRIGSPDASCTFAPTFLTDRELTCLSVKDLTDELAALNVKEATKSELTARQAKTVPEEVATPKVIRSVRDPVPEIKMTKRVIKEKPRPTIVEPIARSVSFCERPRRFPMRRFREFTRFNLLRSTPSTNLVKVQRPPQINTDPLPLLPPDTTRANSRQESPRKRTSSSVSDLTEIGSIFSWHDKEFERRTAMSLEMDADNIGPTSFFQMKKSKSLLDLIKPSGKDDTDGKASELSAFYQKQRLAHLSLRKGNPFRHSSSLSSDEVDKSWKDIVNTQVIDDADYENFASRRKPVTPSTKKHPRLPSPKGSRELKYPPTENGKVYPMFVNVSAQAKKFGRALHYNRKLLKSK